MYSAKIFLKLQGCAYRIKIGMDNKIKKILQNIIISLTSLCLTLGVLELATRLVKGEYVFINFTENIILENDGPIQHDPYLGWIPREGFSGNKDVWKKEITILKNGIRSNTDKKAKEVAGPVSILAVGDSFTFGAQVSNAETWPALLEKISGKTVINGGVSGYGLDQIFLRADHLIKIYKPDTLILSFVADDIYRCRYAKRAGAEKPYIEVEGNRLVLRNVPVPKPSQRKNILWLMRKIFGYSSFISHVMTRASPEFWLQDKKDGGKVVYSYEETEALSYLLFQNFRNIIQTDTLKHVLILVQYTQYPRNEEVDSIDRVLEGIQDPFIKVLDLRAISYQIASRDIDRWNSYYKGHMSPKGNAFVADELLKALKDINAV